MRWALPILIILYGLPALAATLGFALYPQWWLAALCLAVFIGLLGSSPSRLRRLLASGLSLLAGIGSLLLLTALYLQGEGFNDRFFYHFNLESLRIGFEAYPALNYGAGLYMLACIVAPLLLPKRKIGRALHHKSFIPALGLLSAFIFPPAVSATQYIYDQYQINKSGTGRIHREVRDVEALPLTQTPKNLILIYAESLERLYFDDQLFPGLTPHIGSLRGDALEFTNAEQVDGTGWTMAGIVSSQCSLPFNVQYYDGQEAHIGLAAIDEPFKDEICLGDILGAYGYHTVFMGGAPMFFAGKGKFLKANGFDEVLGFETLKLDLKDYRYRNGWGLYDDTLLEMAAAKIDTLAKSETPYLLSVLTVDTHQPSGHIPKDCIPYAEGDNKILNAVTCNDRIVGTFIKDLLARDDMDDTLIVLFSDHLSLRNTAYDQLLSKSDERRLAWMVWGKDIAPGQNAAHATHFDVTPTLLEMMGIPNYRENNWGSSVVDGADGYWFSHQGKAQQAAAQVSYLDMEGNTAKRGISLNSKDKTITIGEKSFTASRGGFSMNDSIFMLLMAPTGAVDAILFANDMEQFTRIAKDYPVIAVSYNEALAPGAVLPPAIVEVTAADEATNGEDDNAPNADAVDSPPLYYYIGTPSKSGAKSRAKTGLLQGELNISGKDMRRVLKGRAIK